MNDPKSRADVLLREAWLLQMKGDLQEAIELYSRSIDIYPTPEAYTFRGWTWSFLGDYEQAIQECLQAIELDPEFGNPYNDIGAYLIEQGKLDEAIPWLEEATRAPRYESYCFPWYNLGRVHERKARYVLAQQCYQRAVAAQPGYDPAQKALKRVHAHWN